jgi:hypothetical protein
MGPVSLGELGIVDVAALPDWVFGERRVIRLEGEVATVTFGMFMGPNALPPRILVWEVCLWMGFGSTAGQYARLGLCDVKPANEAGMLLNGALLPGVGRDGAEPRKIFLVHQTQPLRMKMRQLVATGGGRLCAGFYNPGGTTYTFAAAITYSGVPEFVSDGVARILLGGGYGGAGQ